MLDLTKWPMEREIMLRKEKTGGVDSKAEEIGDFDENLAAIIQEAIGNVEEVAVGILAEAGIEILQVAVVTKVDGGAGVEKIGEEQVGVEVFGPLERSKIRVGKNCRILTDKAKREFASELVVPFRADDVIVEDAGALVEATKAGKQVGVVHGEFSRGAHGEIDLCIAGVCEDRRAKRGVEVGVGTPANLAIQGDLLEETRLEEKSGMTVSVVAVARERAEVRGTKAFVTEITEETEKVLPLKGKYVIGVGEPIEASALVIPIVDGEQAGAMPNHMLAFRTKAVASELAEAANVGTTEETGLGLEALGSVLIQCVVFDLACAVLDVFPKARPALVETVVEIRGADERLRGGVPGVAERDLCVDAADAVGADS